MERPRIESIVESLLFAAGEPVSVKRLAEAVPEASRKDLQAALAALVHKWESDERGLRVIEVAGGYQLQTAAENSPWVGRLLQSRPVRLSRASLETLAIVAYRQPVTRSEIEQVRGVDSGGVLKTLLDHGFVKIMGRKDVPGKPLIYATDQRFLEFFRLKSLAELPTLRELPEVPEPMTAPTEQGELPFPDETGPAGDQPEPADEIPEPEADATADDETSETPEPDADAPADQETPSPENNEDE